MPAIALFVAFLLAYGTAQADFTGRVVRVHNGDTLTVLANGRHVRVRLDSIDAPELPQPFGKEARQSLADLCAGKEASVRETGKNRSGLSLAWVTCGNVEANSEQVRRGMAWVFAHYVPVGSSLYELETYARLRGIGLWSAADPQAPWEWRAERRPAKSAK
jgi:endonuclease YncB( thermonuclease family)